MFSSPGPGDARLQPPPGRRARGRHHHPPDQGDRPRADLPGGPQGHLRRARASPTRWPTCSSGPSSPTCSQRMAERGEATGVIASRVIRTWGMSESGLAEALAGHIRELDLAGRAPARWRPGVRTGATIAFLASGIEGIKVRVTVRADDEPTASGSLDAEEAEIRRILAAAAGDVVFGVDEEAIEDAVARRGHGRRADPRAGRVPDRRAGLVAAGQRARGQSTGSGARWCPTPPRSSSPSWACPRDRWCPRRRPGPWPRAPAGSSSPTSGSVHHRGGRTRPPGRPAPRDGLRGPGPGRPPDRVVRVQRARRPGPGPAVRHHRRPRPVAADARGLGGRADCAEAGPDGRPGRAAQGAVVVAGGREPPSGVTGMPAGTSSTQVLPGCRVIGCPAGGGEGGRLGEAGAAPGAGDGRAVPHDEQRPGPGGRDLDLEAALRVLHPGAVGRLARS